MYNNNKGQVTVYIIIGILLLLLSILILTVRETELPDQQQEQVIGKVPDWATPIKLYTEECLGNVVKNAIQRAGEHGGYINMTDYELSQEDFNSDHMDPVNSDVLYFTSGYHIDLPLEDGIPYWWYYPSPNDCLSCEMSTKLINISVMKDQLNIYLERHLDTCLDDYSSFREQGFIFDLGERKLDVTIDEQDVKVHMTQHMEIEKQGTEIFLNDFEKKLDVNLRKILATGYTVALTEAGTNFLEDIFMHLVLLNSDLNPVKLPPPTWGPVSEFFRIYWSKAYTERLLKEMLLSYIPLIQINNTYGASPFEDEDLYVQGAYNAMFLDIINTSVYDTSDLDINFYYLYWPIYFDITPRTGDKISPSSSTSVFPQQAGGMTSTDQLYESFYDVSFPVIVEIFDKDAFNGEGMMLLFGLEAWVRDNKKALDWFKGNGTIGMWDYNNVEINATIESTECGNCDCVGEGCNDLTGGTWQCNFPGDIADGTTYSSLGSCGQACCKTEATVFHPKPSLMCNGNQRLTDYIAIYTKDKLNGSAIPGADISFGCGTYDFCPLGTTLMYNDGKSAYIDNFPLCYGDGYVHVEKDGYLTKESPLSTSVGLSGYLDVEMTPFKEVEVDVKKYEMLLPDSCCSPPTDIDQGESVMIILEKVDDPDDLYDQPHSVIYTLNEDGTDSGKIKLVPGAYKINAMLMDEAGFVIRKHCYKYCNRFEEGLFNAGECEGWAYAPETDQAVAPAMRGGLVYDKETTGDYWYVDESALYDSSKVTFKIFQTPQPNCIMKPEPGNRYQQCNWMGGQCIAFEEMTRYDEYSGTYRPYIEPAFS